MSRSTSPTRRPGGRGARARGAGADAGGARGLFPDRRRQRGARAQRVARAPASAPPTSAASGGRRNSYNVALDVELGDRPLGPRAAQRRGERGHARRRAPPTSRRRGCPRRRSSRRTISCCARRTRRSRCCDDTVARYERSLQLTRNQYAAGIVARGDVAQAEAQLKSTQAQAIDAGVAARAARARDRGADRQAAGGASRSPRDAARRRVSDDSRRRCRRSCSSAGPTSPPPSARTAAPTRRSASRRRRSSRR